MLLRNAEEVSINIIQRNFGAYIKRVGRSRELHSLRMNVFPPFKLPIRCVKIMVVYKRSVSLPMPKIDFYLYYVPSLPAVRAPRYLSARVPTSKITLLGKDFPIRRPINAICACMHADCMVAGPRPWPRGDSREDDVPTLKYANPARSAQATQVQRIRLVLQLCLSYLCTLLSP